MPESWDDPRVGEHEAAVDREFLVLELTRVVAEPRQHDVETVAARRPARTLRQINWQANGLPHPKIAESDLGEPHDPRERVDVGDVESSDLDREAAHGAFRKGHDLAGPGARLRAELHVEAVAAVEMQPDFGDRAGGGELSQRDVVCMHRPVGTQHEPVADDASTHPPRSTRIPVERECWTVRRHRVIGCADLTATLLDDGAGRIVGSGERIEPEHVVAVRSGLARTLCVAVRVADP